MNIKTTKKLLIVMAFILAFMLLGMANKVEANTKYYQTVYQGESVYLGEDAKTAKGSDGKTHAFSELYEYETAFCRYG